MLHLNLFNPEKSNIKYKTVQYPDGQQTVKLLEKFTITPTTKIKIISPFNSWLHLELIISAHAAIKNYIKELNDQIALTNDNQEVQIPHLTTPIHLFTPYFLGARSDRDFHDGSAHYLKEIIAPIINNQNFASVTVYDPHSDVLEASVDRFIKITNESVVRYALDELKLTNYCFISPDAGSNKKIYDLCQALKYTGEVVRCDKLRDMATGKIIETIVYHDDLNGMDCVIIDDVCSYGGTYKAIAKKLKEKNAGRIFLVTSHWEGVADTASLAEAGITGVITTDSIKLMNDPFINQFVIYNNM